VPLLRVTPVTTVFYGATSIIAILGSFGGLGIPPVGLLALAVIPTLVACLAAPSAEWILQGWAVREPWAFFAAVVLAGVLRGVTVLQGLSILGIDDEVPGGTRILNSVVSIVVWMTIIGLLDASREQYRRRYDALVRQAAAAADVDPGLDDHPDLMRLKSRLSGFAIPSDPRSASLEWVASAIRTEIETSLRPLSHRIWFSSGDPEPRARISRLLEDALLRMPVPVGTITLAWLVTGFAGAASLFGIVRGSLSIVISSVLLFIALVIIRGVMRSARAFWGPVLFVLCAVLPVVGTDIVLASVGYESMLGSVQSLFVILALGGLILCSTAISLAASDRAVILDLVARRVAEFESGTREGLRGEPGELSAFLHNSLQAELHGLALQLDASSRSGDEQQAREALERLGALANRSMSEEFRSFRESPLQRLERVQDAWAGIAELHVEVSDAVEPGDTRLAFAVRAIEEVVANAIRHGGARSAQVSLAASVSGNLLIEIESDGLLSSASPGMGEDWLASVTSAPVVLRESATGSSVRLEI
jgi:hypothetical protein